MLYKCFVSLLNLSSAPFPHASSTTWWLSQKIYFLLASDFARNTGATLVAPCRYYSCLAKINCAGLGFGFFLVFWSFFGGGVFKFVSFVVFFFWEGGAG